MGNKSLSQQLDVTELEAAFFMESFHKTFPQVRQYTKTVVEECRRKGYVETLMKRRRYLPNINAVLPALKSTYLRVCKLRYYELKILCNNVSHIAMYVPTAVGEYGNEWNERDNMICRCDVRT